MTARNRLNGVSVMPPMESRQPKPEKPGTQEPHEPRNSRQRSKPKRSGQRFKILNDFVDCTMQQLTPRQTSVWFCLFRDSRNGVAKSAQVYVAQRCGLKRPTVSTTIGELEALGLVVTIHQGGVNRGLSWYRVSGLVTEG